MFSVRDEIQYRHLHVHVKCTSSYYETHLSKVSGLGGRNEFVFNVYVYFDKQSGNDGITIDASNHTINAVGLY